MKSEYSRLLCTLLVFPSLVYATSYLVPEDYRVTALELDTGKEIWSKTPGPISGRAKLEINHGQLVVNDTTGNPRAERLYFLNPDTGEEETNRRSNPTEIVEPLSSLERNLRDSLGNEFYYSEGSETRLVIANSPVGTPNILNLEAYVYNLHIKDPLAIFTFGSSGGDSGGEVYAWDFRKNQLAWEASIWREVPSIPERAYTGIFIDNDRVLVCVHEHIASLNITDGKIVWLAKLPRQKIRMYDSPWTYIGRYKEFYFAKVYEDLFLLNANDGSIIWHYDAGRFGSPWPLIYGNRIYLKTREGPVERASISYGGSHNTRPSALMISQKKDEWDLEPISRREIPTEQPIWWSLMPPPRSKELENKPQIILTLHHSVQGRKSLKFDITQVANKEETYIKFSRWYSKATLSVDGVTVATTDLLTLKE